MKHALVLLSGGMDSAVALFWAAKSGWYGRIDAMTFNYGQVSAAREVASALQVWLACKAKAYPGMGQHRIVKVDLFQHCVSSILGGYDIDKYPDVETAVKNTDTDKSYIPMRNVVLVSLAAHYLLLSNPNGGTIVLGIRGRADGTGFPDCTDEFSRYMTAALDKASNANIRVTDPLNHGLWHSSNAGPLTRAETIELAKTIPGCFEVLRWTRSCYTNDERPCGHCLPCLRRAEAFGQLRIPDPALEVFK